MCKEKEMSHIERMELLMKSFPNVRTSSENVFVLFKQYGISKYKS